MVQAVRMMTTFQINSILTGLMYRYPTPWFLSPTQDDRPVGRQVHEPLIESLISIRSDSGQKSRFYFTKLSLFLPHHPIFRSGFSFNQVLLIQLPQAFSRLFSTEKAFSPLCIKKVSLHLFNRVSPLYLYFPFGLLTNSSSKYFHPMAVTL